MKIFFIDPFSRNRVPPFNTLYKKYSRFKKYVKRKF